jgi:microcystin-dependent protein
MSNQYLGEVRPFAGNFAPVGWALCNGQLLSIADNTALYAVIGTIYGGDGVTTFALPDLQGRVAVHQGTGLGLTTRVMGEKAGEESVTLTTSTMPSHGHTLNATNTNATNALPASAVLPATPTATNAKLYTTQGPTPNILALSPRACGLTGGSQPHENMMPSLAVTYIIAVQGVFPSQN